MARPKVSVGAQRVPSVTIPSRTLPSAEGVQATETALRPCTGSLKENDIEVFVKTLTAPVVQELERPPRSQWPAVQVKTEQNCSPWPALGAQKLLLEIPISATVPSHIPGAEGQQATAPAIWPSTQLSDEENYRQGSTIFNDIQQLERSPSSQGPALLVKTEQDRSPAFASISTAAVVKVEGVDPGTCSLMPSSGDSQGVSVSKKRKGERKASIVGKKPRAGRISLSFADLVSDTDMRLKDKADKLGVSQTTFKNRRRDAGLGRWPGRGVRAEIKRAQAQARA